VTGGSDGIGLATALALVQQGWRVTLLGRSETRMQAAAARFRDFAPDCLHTVLGDVLAAATRERLVRETTARFGRIDALVNNAGGGSEKRALHEIDTADFNRVVALNLESAFAMCRLVAPGMIAQGFGRIVNIASAAGRDIGRLSGPQYSAAKAGMIGMSRHLAHDLGGSGITVNTVAPGIVMTEQMQRKWNTRSPQEQREILAGIPTGRIGTPEEIADAVLYFCRDGSGYTNGACLDVNGGSFRA
jgi:3-oxoacyl-[acyl-carrier protein] reductase